MITSPLVVIVIINWNNAQDTIGCLDSLVNLNYPNYRILTVDNGSTDGSADSIANIFPDLFIIKLIENKGYGAGCNSGIVYAFDQLGALYCLLLNNDTVIEDRNFLNFLVDSAGKDESIGIVGPLICNYSPPHGIQSAGVHINLFLGNSRLITHLQPKPIWTDAIHGCAFLIKKEIYKKVGLFDEDFFLYWEETDYCFRVRQSGYRILVNPDIYILHKNSASSGKQTALYIYYYFRNRLRFMQKHAQPIHWIVLIMLLPLYTLVHIWKSYHEGNSPLRAIKAIWKASMDFNKGDFGKQWTQ